MHFTDCIRTENCVYDPYKPYGLTNRCRTPLLKQHVIYTQDPRTRCNFPIAYEPKPAFTICTNRTFTSLRTQTYFRLSLGSAEKITSANPSQKTISVT